MVNFDCGALAKMCPTWDLHSDEWVLHFGFYMEDNNRFDTEAPVPRLRTLLKLPDLEIDGIGFSQWVLESVLA
jgi:2,4-dichlorophenol 6-monooxygenase